MEHRPCPNHRVFCWPALGWLAWESTDCVVAVLRLLFHWADIDDTPRRILQSEEFGDVALKLNRERVERILAGFKCSKSDERRSMTQPLQVIIIKPSKYMGDGSVERFRRGFMPNSTVPYMRSMAPPGYGRIRRLCESRYAFHPARPCVFVAAAAAPRRPDAGRASRCTKSSV